VRIGVADQAGNDQKYRESGKGLASSEVLSSDGRDVATGVRLLPLSITLLLAAAGVPKVFPHASPRRVVELERWTRGYATGFGD
jgi:hypothetical protein